MFITLETESASAIPGPFHFIESKKASKMFAPNEIIPASVGSFVLPCA